MGNQWLAGPGRAVRLRRGPAWFLFLLATVSCGCNNQDVDRLANLGRMAMAKAEALRKSPKQLAGGLPSVGPDWGEVSLDSRVSARLRWEKTLANAQIQVHAEGGVVQLQGKVGDPSQRDRAFELASTTQGVEKVLNELEVQPSGP